MEYIQINHIEDPLFRKMHDLMQKVFPKEEVLAYELWKEPLEDPQIRIFAAVKEQEVVGATGYRYYSNSSIAMTDFTLIGQDGLGIGRFLAAHRMNDLQQLAASAGKELVGMFAEIYNPDLTASLQFGGVKAMNSFVRREVLSHLGYRKLDFPYLHPSWLNNGEAVHGLDLCFLPYQKLTSLEGPFIAQFLKNYYSILANKPKEWIRMIDSLEQRAQVQLLPI